MIESVEQNGRTIYRNNGATTWLCVGRPSRVLPIEINVAGRRRAARPMPSSNSAPYVAGKTGTSDDENDALFVGFSNEVTVAVWVGYDNADGSAARRRAVRPAARSQSRLRAGDAGGVNPTRCEPRWRSPRRKRAVNPSPSRSITTQAIRSLADSECVH
jgi:membrane peptidoglycan carboxypeptidase